MIDWDKPVQTRDCREAKVYTISSKNTFYPVLGEFIDDDGVWRTSTWTKEGHVISGETNAGDLVNVPQKHTTWLHVLEAYKGRACGYLYESKQAAVAESKNGNSFAIIEVTFTEGEGLAETDNA